MKNSPRVFKTGLLGCAAMLVFGNVAANDDLDICRAGYKSLLMTPVECKSFLRELRAAQARSDHMTVLDLQEWHASLLIERSQACPCQTKPATMHRVRMTSNSLPKSANSSRY